ncbi:MAG: prephenate dehydrogenase/arogenate dehydrogenase family protein, partial [Acinetobacter sp.]|nr:prephenate dehydrogenase/arogenate dehydrogenase family protein [Acinetobacter sp.]
MWNKVVFIGLGLIGSSLARVIKAKQLAQTIVAVDLNHQTLRDAEALGIADECYQEIAPAVVNADVIILAVPVKSTSAVFAQLKPHLHAHTIITDVGSTKANILHAAQAVFGDAIPSGLVPAHPIAGAEKSGVWAGKVDLFA